jgi:hypothetical protein
MDADKSSLGSLPWFLLGIAGGLGVYWVIKALSKPSAASRPGVTQAAPVAPLTPPSRFADLDSVDARFGQVRELYRMGYMNAQSALGELATLEIAAQSLSEQDAEKAGDILARIESYKGEIQQVASYESVAMKGIRYRVVN